jgi:hypothetical protein
LLSLYHFFGNELKGDLLTIGFSLTWSCFLPIFFTCLFSQRTNKLEKIINDY